MSQRAVLCDILSIKYIFSSCHGNSVSSFVFMCTVKFTILSCHFSVYKKGENTNTISYFCDNWLLMKRTGLKPSSYVKYRESAEVPSPLFPPVPGLSSVDPSDNEFPSQTKSRVGKAEIERIRERRKHAYNIVFM